MGCIHFIILLASAFAPSALGFIPRRCEMDLPGRCTCKFPDRPLVACKGNFIDIPDFPKKLFDAPKIHNLDLSHNRIWRIPADVCEYCEGIKRLDLSHNQINRIDYYAFFKSGWRFSLEYLDLSYNEIHGADLSGLRNLKSLKTLKLDHNELMTVSPGTFPTMDSLSTLTLHGNRMMGINLTGITPKTLYISLLMNLLGVILPDNIEELVVTRAGGLFDNLLNVSTTNFKTVALEYCGINATEIVKSGFFDNVPNLKHLSLKGNRLLSSDSDDLAVLLRMVSHIEYLDLSDIRLTEVKADTFNSLSKLKHLKLASNDIAVVDWKFLESLPNLEDLDLSSNKITSATGMKEPVLAQSKLNSINIGNNPFHCTCENMKELQHIMTISLIEGPHLLTYNQILHTLNCASPEMFVSKTVHAFYLQECSS